MCVMLFRKFQIQISKKQKYLPTRETPHPPNTNNSGHQKQLPTTPLPNTI